MQYPLSPWNWLNPDAERKQALASPAAQAVAQFNQQCERMMDQFFCAVPGMQMFKELVPHTDFEETEKEYVFTAALPAIPEDMLEIHVKNGRLSISGSYEAANGAQDKVQHLFRTSMFQQSLTLPVNADEAGIEADYEDGELRITIPKLKAQDNEKTRVQVNGRKTKKERVA